MHRAAWGLVCLGVMGCSDASIGGDDDAAIDEGVRVALVPDVAAGERGMLACVQLQPSRADAPHSSLSHMFDRIRTGPWCDDEGAWVSGPVDPGTGMVVDFFDVKCEIDAWDHRHLNDEVEFVPTAELLAAEMRRRILSHVAAAAGADRADQVGVLLRLWETPSGYAQVGWLTRDPAEPGYLQVVDQLELDPIDIG